MAIILPYRGVLPKIDKTAFVAENAVVSGSVTIGPESSLWYGCVARGDVNSISIGAGSNIQDLSVIHVSGDYPTVIGDGVSIGHMALIHACTLEDNSFIGMKACVMDGAVVETGAMLAAGALLTPGKRIPKGELWAGSPARFVRKVGEREIAMMEHVRPNYIALGREYKKTEEEM